MSMSESINNFFREHVAVYHEGVLEEFREGVEDASSTKNIFVDPDSIEDAEALKQHLEAQHPGITDQLWQTFKDEGLIRPANPDAMFEIMASRFVDAGPAALRHDQLQTEDGQHICIINEPSRDYDQKEEMVNAIRANFDDLDQNISVPGGDIDYARAIGVHEGTHCDQDDENYASVREKEIDADIAALKDQLERGNTSVAKEIYEAREIGALNGSDYAHQTASGINYDKVLKDTFNAQAQGETEPQHTPSHPKVGTEPGFDLGM